MAKIKQSGFLFLVLVPALAISKAADLGPETLQAWDHYVQMADLRMKARVKSAAMFLWVDEAPLRSQRVRDGEVLVSCMDGDRTEALANGLIHDWAGAVFIPDVTINDVFAVVQDYDRYKDFYKPAVIDAKLLGRTGEERKFSMSWLQKVLFVTAALDGEYKSSYFQLNPRRWYSITRSTRVQEVREYGQPGERKLPPDQGNGYLWRLFSIARYEERDGGVYVELEAIGLSRNIPVSLRWFVAPVVDRLSRDSVTASLRQTRSAVNSMTEVASRVAGGESTIPAKGALDAHVSQSSSFSVWRSE